jgi:Tfp pilus assembly protein PilN
VTHQVNLYDAALLPGRRPFSSGMMLAATALLVVGVLVVYAVAELQVRRLAPLAAVSERQVTERRDQLLRESQKVAGPASSKLLDDEIARLESRVTARRGVLQDLTQAEGPPDGFSPYLRGLARRRTEGVWLTKVSILGSASELVLEGRALAASAVPVWLGSLRTEPVFSGRNVAELRISAREATRGAGSAAQGAATPARFVEFSVTLPGGSGAARAPGVKP